MSEQRWRTIRSRSILKDRWIDVRADECLTPSGATVDPYYVLSYPDWVHVVAVTPDDGLVLVHQYRHAVGEVLAEIPCGMVDATDADHEQAARRELAEETGYTATAWRSVGSFFPNPATHTNRVHVFLAQDAVPTEARHLDPGEEGLQVRVLPVEDVLRGLRHGLLAQAMQVSSVILGLATAGRIGLDRPA